MKKILCLFVSLVLVLSIVSLTISAEPDVNEQIRIRFSVGSWHGMQITEEEGEIFDAAFIGSYIVIYKDGAEYVRARYLLDGANYGNQEMSFYWEASEWDDGGSVYWTAWGIDLNLYGVNSLIVRLYMPEDWMPGGWFTQRAEYMEQKFVRNHEYVSDDESTWDIAGFDALEWGSWHWHVMQTYYAHPTTSTVLVNGELIDFQAYNINGFNFFKLRDIAYVLNGTSSQFDIEWNVTEYGSTLITLWQGRAYQPVGSEMVNTGDGARIPLPASVTTRGERYPPNPRGSAANFGRPGQDVYNIDGYNFFMLRDLAFDARFNVDWDEETNTILITTD